LEGQSCATESISRKQRRDTQFGVPGCRGAGLKVRQKKEALENIKDAIQAYLETKKELSN
jgi:phosphoglucomutase